MRRPEELLYDFEASLRLVDHMIAELSDGEPAGAPASGGSEPTAPVSGESESA